jgi:hypothetical protein
MITTAVAAAMTNQALTSAANDIQTVIASQEEMDRLRPGSCPKLENYQAELVTVQVEIKKRMRELAKGKAP